MEERKKHRTRRRSRKKTSPVKKTLSAVKDIFVWIVTAAAIFMMIFTIISVSTFDRTDRSLFGFKAFIVISDSMSRTDFNSGDLILVKETNPAELREGDIIAYTSQNTESFGETITHKIRRLTTDENGAPGFITYGTTTDTDDSAVVTYAFVLGKYTARLPKVGAFFQFLKTAPGYICCILLPFLLLIAFQGLNCILLFRRYKSEQHAELMSEKAKIEAEREESRKMMQEIIALKARLNESTDKNQPM